MISVRRTAISLKKRRKCEKGSLVLFNSSILRYKYSNHANIDRYQCRKSAALTRKLDFFFNQKTTSKKHPKHPKNRDSQSPFGGED